MPLNDLDATLTPNQNGWAQTYYKLAHTKQITPSTAAARQGRPAANGRVLVRLVIGQEHSNLTPSESVGTERCHMSRKHSSHRALASRGCGTTRTRRNTGRHR